MLDAALLAPLLAVLKPDDDYRALGKPACDWDDQAARQWPQSGAADEI